MARSSLEAQFLDEFQRHMGERPADEQQIAAICAPDGPVLVDAGPGAGKTTVLTWRTAYLLRVRKVSPDKVFVVTFTKNAASELKERLARL